MHREDEIMSDMNKSLERQGELSSKNSSLSNEISKFRNKNEHLTSEKAKLSLDIRKNSEDLLKIKGECTQLQYKNDSLEYELKSLQKSVSLLEDEKLQIQSNKAALSAEINCLKTSLENQIQQSTSDANIQEEIRSLQLELSSKVNECSDLNIRLVLVEEKLRKSDAQNINTAKDLAKTIQGHLQTICELQKQLDSHVREVEETRRLNSDSTADLERRLSFEIACNERLQQEKSSFAQKHDQLQTQFEHTTQNYRHERSQNEVAIESITTQLNTAQDGNLRLSDQINSYAQQIERLSSLSEELQSTSRERDILKEALVDSKTYIARLEVQFDDLNSSLRLNSCEPESILKILKDDRIKQLLEIETLNRRINDIESEKHDIEMKFEKYRKSYVKSQNDSAASALNIVKEEARMKKMQEELLQLRIQLQNATAEIQNSEDECLQLSNKCTELQDEILRLREVGAQINRLQQDLLQVQERNESQEMHIQSLENRLSESERIFSHKEKEIVNLKEQQQSHSCTIDEIENENVELLSKLQNANARLNELESECEDIEEKNLTIDQLNEELQVLVNESDALQSSMDDLVVENEDMLVQFGLLNEEMEEKENELTRLREIVKGHENELEALRRTVMTYEEELQRKVETHQEELQRKVQTHEEELHRKETKKGELENNLQLAQQTSERYQDRLKMSEKKLNALISESEEMMKNAGNVDNNTKKLVEVNTALRDKIGEMTSEQSAAAEQIQAMESHKLGLNGKVEDLQNLVDELIASFETKESKLQATIDDINLKKNEISNKSTSQESEIARLREQLEVSKGYAEECTTLRRTLAGLENKLCEQERLLLQKDAAAQDLFNQLQNEGNALVETAELDMLRQRVQDMEASIAIDKEQLREIGMKYDDTQLALTRNMEQLRSSEEITQQLQDDLHSKQDTESTNQMLESRMAQLEQELMSGRARELKYRDEAADLTLEVISLRASTEQNSNLSAELLTLRRQVEALERDKDTTSSEVCAREVVMERELRALKDQMAEKDDQIASMEDKLQSINSDLSQSKIEVNAKQLSIEELTVELDKVKSIPSTPTSLGALELARGQAESIDTMRSQIIWLAQILEDSENKRAEGIENVEKERQKNADTLRRMTDTMKRFYATLNMSD